jgi:hypothetical protein
MIGVHCRGPGRIDGGVKFMLWTWGYNDVPYDKYFDLIESQPDTDILLCSDAQIAIDTFKQRFGNRVITTDAWRPTFGEPHRISRGRNIELIDGSTSGPEDTETSPVEIARQGLIDCCVLSRCNNLLCGSSNLALFASYLNPDLPVSDIYAEFYGDPATSRSKK